MDNGSNTIYSSAFKLPDQPSSKPNETKYLIVVNVVGLSYAERDNTGDWWQFIIRLYDSDSYMNEIGKLAVEKNISKITFFTAEVTCNINHAEAPVRASGRTTAIDI